MEMELYPVSVDILYDGMMVDDGIYHYKDGKFVLLCKDVILNEKMIGTIKATIEQNNNVYMYKANRDRALRETAYFEMAQAFVEKKIGYDVMRGIMKDFVNSAFENGVVSNDTVDSIARDIQTKLDEFDDSLIIQCLNGIRGIDEYLYVHSLNVGFLNGMMGKWCGIDKDTCYKLVKAGLVHDLGKLKVSPEILNKPARLTMLEYEAVKRHPGFSWEMLQNSGEEDELILDAVRHHHERINGTGYPDKLGVDAISAAARITAISDVYDAMVAERPYKGASTPFVILQELMDTSFSGLDMQYVNVLLKNIVKELTGRMVLLSNGAVARVEYVDEREPKYPIVNIDGETMKTDGEVFCVKVYAG